MNKIGDILELKPPKIGDIVVIQNYHVGEFLETWNGEFGILKGEDNEFYWIKFSSDTVSLGFPKKCVLALHGGFLYDINYLCKRFETIHDMITSGVWKETWQETAERIKWNNQDYSI